MAIKKLVFRCATLLDPCIKASQLPPEVLELIGLTYEEVINYIFNSQAKHITKA